MLEKLHNCSLPRWLAYLVVVAAIASTAYVTLTPRVYESSATFSLGYFIENIGAGGKLIEEPKELRRWLQAKPGVVLAALESGNIRQITVKAQAGSAEEARAILQGIVDEVIGRHRQLYNEVMTRHKKVQQEIQQELDTVRKEIARVDARIAKLPAGDDSLAGSVLRLERVGLWQLQAELLRRVNTSETLLTGRNAAETELLQPVRVNARPIRPNLFLAFVLPVIILVAGVGVKFLWKLR